MFLGLLRFWVLHLVLFGSSFDPSPDPVLSCISVHCPVDDPGTDLVPNVLLDPVPLPVPDVDSIPAFCPVSESISVPFSFHVPTIFSLLISFKFLVYGYGSHSQKYRPWSILPLALFVDYVQHRKSLSTRIGYPF